MGAAACTLWSLLADLTPEEKVARDERTLWLTATLAGVLLLGAIVLSWLQRWRKRQMAADDNPVASLTTYRAMYEAGELSKEEYERILARVASRTKAKLGVKPPEPPARPAPPEPNLPPPSEHPG